MLVLVTRLAVVLLALASPAFADPVLVSPEVDPLPFATGGYGTQLGVRHPRLPRIAVASFSVNVPDLVTELGGNDGFHLRVRPSAAVYVLHYFAAPGRDGFCVGGSVRYLRLRYEHDEVPGMRADVGELSPEAIVGYQWHPFDNGFYAQPWLGLSFTLARDGEPVVGDRRYNPMPIQPFFTVNVGWEFRL
jgi:hypothetical protein